MYSPQIIQFKALVCNNNNIWTEFVKFSRAFKFGFEFVKDNRLNVYNEPKEDPLPW